MRAFLLSFRWAFRGVGIAMRQRNFRIHLAVVVIVSTLGALVGLARGEWLAIALACGLVLCAEAMNTALELVCDAVTRERNPVIGQAKDVAAGAVLLAALSACVVGGIVFFPILADRLFGCPGTL